MPGDEIEVPKELREFMLEEAEETFLGKKMEHTNNIVMVIYTLENMMKSFSFILIKLILEQIQLDI